MTIVARTRDVLERTGAEIAAATGVKVTPVAADITTERGTRCRACGLSAARYPAQQRRRPAAWRFPRLVARRLDRRARHDDAVPIEMMRLTVDGMMARGFGRILNIVSRSVKIPQARARAFERRALRARRLRRPDWRDRRSPTTSPSTICCRASSTAMRSASTSGHVEQSGKTFEEFGTRAPRPIRRNATAGRPSSAPIAPFFARNMPVSSPAKTC